MPALHRGFTLIELIMVIVVLGSLAAMALCRFIGLNQEAVSASVQGVAGAGACNAANAGGTTVSCSITGQKSTASATVATTVIWTG